MNNVKHFFYITLILIHANLSVAINLLDKNVCTPLVYLNLSGHFLGFLNILNESWQGFYSTYTYLILTLYTGKQEKYNEKQVFFLQESFDISSENCGGVRERVERHK